MENRVILRVVIVVNNDVIKCTRCCCNAVVLAMWSCMQSIMKDQWINIGYEDDKLKPFAEPSLLIDQKRIGTLFCCLILFVCTDSCTSSLSRV